RNGCDRHVIEISGYRLLRQLGRGGMATVYLAVQESVDREVALKVMSPALLADPNFGERFLREAKIAAKLHHRHVVGIHDVGRSGDYHYMAMEYLGGGPVLHKDGNPRPVSFALRVIREIATALDYAHKKGFVHRDVKPDNILLRDDGTSVLTDFGIARALDPAAKMTQTGAVVGTPHYMSPEQARGRPIDGRSDLYGLGIVLYEMLVGRVPYQADDSLAVGIMHISQPVPVLPDAIARLQPLITRMLAKDPEDRYQDGLHLASAIARCEAGENVEGEDDRPAKDPAPREGARRETPVVGFFANTPTPQAATPTPPLRHTPTPPASTPRDGGAHRERAEPNIGRLDEIVAAVGSDPRSDRARAHQRERKGSRSWVAATLLVLVAIGGAAAWMYQDRLRAFLPRTEFNDTLTRAQRALDEGRLMGTPDSARELFQAARAQDPDNDVARTGLERVGKKLLLRAGDELKANDPAAARQSLDAARELLGGGAAVDAFAQALAKAESGNTETAAQFDQAKAALDAGRVLGDDGSAALYKKLLAADPTNAVAQAGLSKSADALAVQARSAFAARDFATASARVDAIAAILPAYPALSELRGQLAQAREADRAAVNDDLDRAEAAVRAGTLSGGEGSALELYRDVLKRDPGNARAKTGLRRIAQSLIVQAGAAIDDNRADEAEKLLASAAQLAPELPELREARINLRELHERMDIDAQRPTLTAADHENVTKLVAEAAQAASAGNLIIPPGDSAYDKYRDALAIDGNNRDALDGIAKLPERAKELFTQALADGTPQRARMLLDTVRQIAPSDSSIAPMAEKLANVFIDTAEARVREGRRDDAVRALDAAKQLSPVNPRLAPLDARIRALPNAQQG
ncbi:MAG TPA: protein kinase, partial [Rhodanobacteraceae bacterium]|nr:protein kinase [Rhodanobacteraceae bacterium]